MDHCRAMSRIPMLPQEDWHRSAGFLRRNPHVASSKAHSAHSVAWLRRMHPGFLSFSCHAGVSVSVGWLQSSNLTLASGLLSQGVMSRALGANIWPASHIAVGGGASIGSGA